MVDRIPNRGHDGSPRDRLESWLVRKIQGGVFKSLPPYHPMGGRADECPEHYARALLAGLRAGETDRRALERIKDDGRAFRSWTESVLPGLARDGGGRGNRLAPGFTL